MTFELLKGLASEERASLYDVIAPSVGNPAQERLNAVLNSYFTDDSRVLLIANEGKEPAGCVGLERKENQVLEILHIAVRDKFRGQGIGRELINESIRRFYPKAINAVTDDDAIGFYLKSDFKIFETFENKWKVRRYRVRRELRH